MWWWKVVGTLVFLSLTLPQIAWLGAPNEKSLRRILQLFCDATQAYVDPVFVPAFLTAARRGLQALTALALIWVVGLYAFFWVGPDLGSTLFTVVVSGFGFALWTIVRLRSAGREFPVPAGRPAIARPRRVVTPDYVSPAVRGLLLFAVAASVALTVLIDVSWRAGRSSDSDAAIATADGATVLALALLAIGFGRAMCARPEPAMDASHLYFLDAWRAVAINRAYVAVCVVATLSANLGMAARGPLWFERNSLVATQPTLWICLFVGFVSLRSRRFRRRLWGGLPPGSVLLPGQPAPPRIPARA